MEQNKFPVLVRKFCHSLGAVNRLLEELIRAAIPALTLGFHKARGPAFIDFGSNKLILMFDTTKSKRKILFKEDLSCAFVGKRGSLELHQFYTVGKENLWAWCWSICERRCNYGCVANSRMILTMIIISVTFLVIPPGKGEKGPGRWQCNHERMTNNRQQLKIFSIICVLSTFSNKTSSNKSKIKSCTG